MYGMAHAAGVANALTRLVEISLAFSQRMARPFGEIPAK
jgi:hypothetical protein